jgi:hypothetical protein
LTGISFVGNHLKPRQLQQSSSLPGPIRSKKHRIPRWARFNPEVDLQMAYEQLIGEHTYVFDVDYGEEHECARIIVRSAEGGPEGLFLVDAEGAAEPADDIEGFGPNPAAADGLWPLPPDELIEDARRIAVVKGSAD